MPKKRAFRDMLKDAWSIEQGWKPTLRIPASIVGWKRNSLNEQDWKILLKYIQDHKN